MCLIKIGLVKKWILSSYRVHELREFREVVPPTRVDHLQQTQMIKVFLIGKLFSIKKLIS